MLREKIKSRGSSALKAVATFLKVGLMLSLIFYFVASGVLFYNLNLGATKNFKAVVDKQKVGIEQLKGGLVSCQKGTMALVDELKALKLAKVDKVINKYMPKK